jgi:hypothetical protein
MMRSAGLIWHARDRRGPALDGDRACAAARSEPSILPRRYQQSTDELFEGVVPVESVVGALRRRRMQAVKVERI